MLIERIEVRLLALPMREAFGAAHGTMRHREITVLRVMTDEGHGWGECAALSEATYSDEHAAGAFDVLASMLGPRLIGQRLDAAGALHRLAPVAGQPMAKAAVEMALLDVALRAAGCPLASWLSDGSPVPATVPAGAVVGLGSPAEVAERVAQLVAEGFGRVKIKVMPGHDREVVAAVRERCGDRDGSADLGGLDLQADGNGSYRAEHLPLLTSLAAAGLGSLEQPFSPTEPELAAQLVAATIGTGLMVMADEAATDRAAVEHLRQAGALRGVAVKPSRLGGLAAARDLHAWCHGHGLALTAGGMVETGLGRHALAALAALPGFTVTGDVSPAGRWLAADPWPDLTMVGGRIVVPSGPGVAPDPDHDLLDHHTVRRAELTA